MGVASSEMNSESESVVKLLVYGSVVITCDSPSSEFENLILTDVGLPATRYSILTCLVDGSLVEPRAGESGDVGGYTTSVHPINPMHNTVE